MKSILALSGIALVIASHAARADPAHPLDPQALARQSILGVTRHSATILSTKAAVAQAPTDPHELARQRIVATPAAEAALRPASATEAQPTIDLHERARRTILGDSVELGTNSTPLRRW